MAKKASAKARQVKKTDDKLATYNVVFDYVESVDVQITARNVREAIKKAYENRPVCQVCMIYCTEKTLPDGTVVNLNLKESDEHSESIGSWDTV